MKVILYMAISIDGFISKENDDTSWVSEAEYDAFRAMAKNVGNVIYGRTTYDLGISEKISPLAGAINVIVTHQPLDNYSPYIFTNQSPEEILAMLKAKKFDSVVVCGGSQINALFATFIDEIYLDIEPIVLGKGKKLFSDFTRRINLHLLETKPLTSQTLQLHYKVVKE